MSLPLGNAVYASVDRDTLHVYDWFQSGTPDNSSFSWNDSLDKSLGASLGGTNGTFQGSAGANKTFGAGLHQEGTLQADGSSTVSAYSFTLSGGKGTTFHIADSNPLDSYVLDDSSKDKTSLTVGHVTNGPTTTSYALEHSDSHTLDEQGQSGNDSFTVHDKSKHHSSVTRQDGPGGPSFTKDRDSKDDHHRIDFVTGADTTNLNDLTTWHNIGEHVDCGPSGLASYVLDDDQGSDLYMEITASNWSSWVELDQGVTLHADMSSGSAMGTTTTWSTWGSDLIFNGMDMGGGGGSSSFSTTAPVTVDLTTPDLSGIVLKALSGASLSDLVLPFLTGFSVLVGDGTRDNNSGSGANGVSAGGNPQGGKFLSGHRIKELSAQLMAVGEGLAVKPPLAVAAIRENGDIPG